MKRTLTNKWRRNVKLLKKNLNFCTLDTCYWNIHSHAIKWRALSSFFKESTDNTYFVLTRGNSEKTNTYCNYFWQILNNENTPRLKLKTRNLNSKLERDSNNVWETTNIYWELNKLQQNFKLKFKKCNKMLNSNWKGLNDWRQKKSWKWT